MAREPKIKRNSTDEQQKAKAISRWENEGGAKAKPRKRGATKSLRPDQLNADNDG